MKTIERRSVPGWGRGLAVSLFLVASVSTACSGRVGGSQAGAGSSEGASASVDDPRECSAYFQVYGACMHRLSPQSPEVAEARVSNAREAMQRLPVSQARAACIDGTAQLKAACP